MTILGILLLIVGAAATVLILTGLAPEALLALPVPFWVWIVVAVVGLLLVFFNRRPGD